MLIVSDNARLIMLECLLKSHKTLRLKLYSNEWYPGASDVPSDYKEVVWPGYGEVILYNYRWMFSQIAPGSAEYPERTWTFRGWYKPSIKVYGYYVVDETGDKLMWAESFETPFELDREESEIELTPVMRIGGCELNEEKSKQDIFGKVSIQRENNENEWERQSVKMMWLLVVLAIISAIFLIIGR